MIPMRRFLLLLCILLLTGCEASKTPPPLTAEQAGTLSAQLANDKADAVYHHRPFQSTQPANFEAGRWVWTDSHGVGTFDFQAKVELAANGSTNNVDINVLDDALRPTRGRFGPGQPPR